jgi:hypothetical protein
MFWTRSSDDRGDAARSPSTSTGRSAVTDLIVLDRDDYILAGDGELLAQCAVDTYRASGPGGQHRNKTESGVRLRHQPTGVIAHADESRSQADNRATALERLREHLALDLRLPHVLVGWRPSPRLESLIAEGPAALGERTRRKPGFLVALAHLLDLFESCKGEVGATARHLGITTAQCSKFLLIDARTHRAVNQVRHVHGLRPLR